VLLQGLVCTPQSQMVLAVTVFGLHPSDSLCYPSDTIPGLAFLLKVCDVTTGMLNLYHSVAIMNGPGTMCSRDASFMLISQIY
jgi:hypothetical protein